MKKQEELMEIFDPNEKLPEPNEYVLVHLSITNWGDNQDPEGNRYWRVAKFRLGKREPNNQKEYYWDEFGPSCHFGQAVDKWTHLPKIKESNNAS